ncbi:GHKL domain-containing protein [Paenibacillus sp. GSMTC-2017]|uniref:GHKL domain-containing protein n=1 Tax=Paenibacillus sp. GSMTC-2017 TaxID=2794350 RepID=UPI0018D924FE|nr:GHKL domain-containing protein [Paenibacillus sp. GSMTC-2017]MBH5320090.1 GHKL domain-containing protein [Paenibacillus sp. GSMTC-2017]
MLFFFIVLIQMAMYCLSIPILLKERLGWKTITVMLIGAQSICYNLFPIMGAMSTLVVLVFLTGCMYAKTKKVLMSITIPIIPVLFMVISDYTISLLTIHFLKLSNADLQQKPLYLLILLTGISILGITFCYVGRYLFYKVGGNELFFKRYGLLITIMTVLTLAIFYINIWLGKKQGFSDEIVRANSILFFFYFFIIIAVCAVLMRIVLKETNLQNQQTQYNRLTVYTQDLESLYVDMQKFRHDYVNILLTMSEYIRSKDVDRLQVYFEQKILPISQSMQSSNFKLDALHNVKVQELKRHLSSKLIRAQALNIDVVTEVSEPIVEVNMNSIVLIRCLDIMLDSAIEEAVLCAQPSVNLSITKSENSVDITITNSCQSKTPFVLELLTRGFTSKGTDISPALKTLTEIVSTCDTAELDTQLNEFHFTQQLKINSFSKTAKKIG